MSWCSRRSQGHSRTGGSTVLLLLGLLFPRVKTFLKQLQKKKQNKNEGKMEKCRVSLVCGMVWSRRGIAVNKGLKIVTFSGTYYVGYSILCRLMYTCVHEIIQCGGLFRGFFQQNFMKVAHDYAATVMCYRFGMEKK